jgi:hypothetical protein
MILLNQIIQIFRGAYEPPLSMRQPALTLERPPEGGCDIQLGPEQKIDCLSLFVDSTIKISSATFDLHVGLVNAPRCAGSAWEAAPSLFEFRDVACNPTHDRPMGQRNSALGHHFHEISKAELEPQIPADTKDDNLLVELAPFEEIIHSSKGHLRRIRPAPAGECLLLFRRK